MAARKPNSRKPYTTTEALQILRERGLKDINLRTIQTLCEEGKLRCVPPPEVLQRVREERGAIGYKHRRIPVSALEEFWARSRSRVSSPNEQTLRTAEAAAYLTERGYEVSPMTVRRWCDDGTLRCLRNATGKQRLILQSVLDDYLKSVL